MAESSVWSCVRVWSWAISAWMTVLGACVRGLCVRTAAAESEGTSLELTSMRLVGGAASLFVALLGYMPKRLRTWKRPPQPLFRNHVGCSALSEILPSP
jgi:hypothetical protein